MPRPQALATLRATSTGSPAASPSRAASRACARSRRASRQAYLIGEAADEFAGRSRRPGARARRSARSTRRVDAASARRAASRGRRGRSSCWRRPAPRSTSSRTSRHRGEAFRRLAVGEAGAAMRGGGLDRSLRRAPTGRCSAHWWWTVDRVDAGRRRPPGADRPRSWSSPPARAVGRARLRRRRSTSSIARDASCCRRRCCCSASRCCRPRACCACAVVMLRRCSAACCVLTLFIGPEVKGARRWLPIGGFADPAARIREAGAGRSLVAWPAAPTGGAGLPASAGRVVAAGAGRAGAQPDVGMAAGGRPRSSASSCSWPGSPGSGWSGSWRSAAWVLWQAYLFLPHFTRAGRPVPRSGIASATRSTTRCAPSPRAACSAAGPGEGVSKCHLPDAHADFIFAVTAEEFGLIACLVLVGLFAFLILRGLWRVTRRSDRFVLLAAGRASWRSSACRRSSTWRSTST